jgi:hypothetical protein
MKDVTVLELPTSVQLESWLGRATEHLIIQVTVNDDWLFFASLNVTRQVAGKVP